MARPSRLSTLSTADLHREIARRQRSARTLARKRTALARRIAALDAKIAVMGGEAASSRGKPTGGGTSRRFKNAKPLAESLRDVLKGKTMRVVDAAAAVQKAGYRTSGKSFNTMVGIALAGSGKFRRVRRGLYTAK